MTNFWGVWATYFNKWNNNVFFVIFQKKIARVQQCKNGLFYENIFNWCLTVKTFKLVLWKETWLYPAREIALQKSETWYNKAGGKWSSQTSIQRSVLPYYFSSWGHVIALFFHCEPPTHRASHFLPSCFILFWSGVALFQIGGRHSFLYCGFISLFILELELRR